MARGRGFVVMEVQGASRVRRMLRRAGNADQLLGELKAEHARIASMVENAASSRAPRRTGRLAGSMRSSGTRTGAIVRAGGARVPYAGPIHWGWPARNIAAQPWIAEAAQATESSWVADYDRALRALMGRIETRGG